MSLDAALLSLSETLAKLKSAQSVDVRNVIEQLTVAAESARDLRAYVGAELPQAAWRSRDELDALLVKIQRLAEARALEQLRGRLLALADELAHGRIVHRRAARVDQLNELRGLAISELRSLGPKTLPGPDAAEWIEWACLLKEPEDADTLGTLRLEFPNLHEFVVNLDQGMWVGAEPSAATVQESTTSVRPAQPRYTPPWSRRSLRIRRMAAPTGEASPVASSSEEPAPSPVVEKVLFGDTGDVEPGGLSTRVIGMIAGAVLILIVVAGLVWSSHRSRATAAVNVQPAQPAVVPPVISHKQPIEGAQSKILVTVEACARKSRVNIECWGYVSNLSDQPSNVTLARADVIDARGNTFNVSSNGQFDFETGRIAKLPGGANAKYTINVPDADEQVKTLTFYLDLSKPRELEFTFRDVPVTP